MKSLEGWSLVDVVSSAAPIGNTHLSVTHYRSNMVPMLLESRHEGSKDLLWNPEYVVESSVVAAEEISS